MLHFDITGLTNPAAKADVIVLCIVEKAYAESPGNKTELALDENQQALAKTGAFTGKPVKRKQ